MDKDNIACFTFTRIPEYDILLSNFDIFLTGGDREMVDYISKLKKVCDIIFTTLQLDVFAVTYEEKVLVNLFHEANPDDLSVYWADYLTETKKKLEVSQACSCFWHEITDCSLIFLDVHLLTPEGSSIYLVIGPALTKVYNDSFYQSLVSSNVLSAKGKTAAVTFFKSVPFFSSKVKNAFWISYLMLQQLPQLEDFAIDAPAVSQHMLSSEDPKGAQLETRLTKDEILTNYENEKKWRAFVAAGDSCSAKKALVKMSSNDFSYRHATDPIRAVKNAQLALNAICKAAAYDGGAFATDIHNTHEQFAVRIENAGNMVDIERIYSEMLESYCALVIASRTRAFSPPVRKAITYLYHHYEEAVTLHSIAENIHYSEGHLSRTFQKETGKTIGTYLNELRIDHACRLLETGVYSITDVAMQVGFLSYTKFSIAFKKIMGMCATDFLRNSKVKSYRL